MLGCHREPDGEPGCLGQRVGFRLPERFFPGTRRWRDAVRRR